MIIAMMGCGDLLGTVVRHIPLAPNEEPTFEFLLRDLPTGKTEELSFVSEKEAICCFAAWIMADEPERAPEFLEILRSRLTDKDTFLP